MVGYRYFCRGLAQKLHISGTVQNLEDGSVEVIADGKKENLNQFLESLEKGPLLAKVESFEVEDNHVGNADKDGDIVGFEILG